MAQIPVTESAKYLTSHLEAKQVLDAYITFLELLFFFLQIQ